MQALTPPKERPAVVTYPSRSDRATSESSRGIDARSDRFDWDRPQRRLGRLLSRPQLPMPTYCRPSAPRTPTAALYLQTAALNAAGQALAAWSAHAKLQRGRSQRTKAHSRGIVSPCERRREPAWPRAELLGFRSNHRGLRSIAARGGLLRRLRARAALRLHRHQRKDGTFGRRRDLVCTTRGGVMASPDRVAREADSRWRPPARIAVGTKNGPSSRRRDPLYATPPSTNGSMRLRQEIPRGLAEVRSALSRRPEGRQPGPDSLPAGRRTRPAGGYRESPPMIGRTRA
jgi:hypothetical protein